MKKAFSKAKGVLTLVPLPKIDEIYAQLKGSKIYSLFDMRSRYYHMVLSKKSRQKTAFVSSYGKWEFKRCPLGLAQAPAYLQRLINEILSAWMFLILFDLMKVWRFSQEQNLNVVSRQTFASSKHGFFQV